jgi:NAD+ synthase (glutamine-hydrolysing)
MIPFGTQLLFRCNDKEIFTFAVEIGEDVFAPIPPSTHYALNGATIIVNPSAHAGFLTEHQLLMVKGQSARLACAYINSNAGKGESSTDAVYFGEGIICELGEVLQQGNMSVSVTDIDLHAIGHERQQNNFMQFKYTEAVYCPFYFSLTGKLDDLRREIKHPFTGMSLEEVKKQFDYTKRILTEGLEKRLTHTNSSGVVLGVSGGLDSTFALLIIAEWLKANSDAGASFSNFSFSNFSIEAITMPCFGTSERTKNNAYRLCKALGIDLREIDITESVKIHLRDIGHSFSNSNLNSNSVSLPFATKIRFKIS